MAELRLTVNGTPAVAEVEGRTLLSDLLRDGLGLTGTH
ncbi:MAG: (2Fe-2S)-binding protein, partial [Pseudomonadota bacterium]